MIVVSLLLILVSGALLATGILQANDPLVMASIGVSALAAAALFLGIRQQQRGADARPYGPDTDARTRAGYGLGGTKAAPAAGRTIPADSGRPAMAARSGAVTAPPVRPPLTPPPFVTPPAARPATGSAAATVPAVPAAAPAVGSASVGRAAPPAREPDAATAPATETPAAEVPADDRTADLRVPARDADEDATVVVDPPAVHAPAVEAPAAEAPVVEAPAEEASADEPRADEPRADEPAADQAAAGEPPERPVDAVTATQIIDLDAVPPPAAADAEPAEPEPDEQVALDEDDDEDPPDEPAAELLMGSEVSRLEALDNEVLVVDGRPRYHLTGCPHLADKESQPLPVSEAVELGFTACSLCGAATAILAESAPR